MSNHPSKMPNLFFLLFSLRLSLPMYFTVKVLIDSKYFFCKSSVKFIPIDEACDGKNDCSGGEDEITCLSRFTVTTTFPGKTKRAALKLLSPRAQKKTPILFLFFLCHFSLQCVSSRGSGCCRCTVQPKAGGLCVATYGPSSTRRRPADNWATHRESTREHEAASVS